MGDIIFAMHIPINVAHWYVGIIIMIIIAVRSLVVARRNQNSLNNILGIASFTFILCLLAYGIPPLFTTNSTILTMSIIAGDFLQFIALFWVWVAVAHIYVPNSKLIKWVMIIADILIITMGMVFSVSSNIQNPVIMTQLPSGEWNIYFAFSLGYQIITAIQYLSLILLASRFILDGIKVKSGLQRVRLCGTAIGFYIIGGFYAIRPIVGNESTANTQNPVLVIGLLVTGIMVGATIMLNYIQNNQA